MQRMWKNCAKLVNEAIKNFPIMYQFCNGDLDKFVLLLRKDVYPCEDMDSWGKFKETSFPDKKAFYSELNLEAITDEEYAHGQKVWELFEIKNRGEYHDFDVQCDTLLLADTLLLLLVFENFRDKCIELCIQMQTICMDGRLPVLKITCKWF